MSEYLNEMIGWQVQSTAEWRRQKAEEFPGDSRNLRAAEELERLGKEIDALNGSEIEKQISAAEDGIHNLGDNWEGISQAVSDELRGIGFHTAYGTATEFLEWYRDLLDEKLHEQIERAVPAPDLRDKVENDPTVKAAKRAYETAYAEALAKARETL